jgi:hypothetical protein
MIQVQKIDKVVEDFVQELLRDGDTHAERLALVFIDKHIPNPGYGVTSLESQIQDLVDNVLRSEWIDLNKEKPKEFKEYSICNVLTKLNTCATYVPIKNTFRSMNGYEYNVTHWRELPELPKE